MSYPKAFSKYVQLCSFDDDVIKTSNLNKTAVAKLRKFLYGGNTKKIKQQTCSDKDFLLLLFGSMGSTDEHLEDDAKDVRSGQECGMLIDGYDDIKPGDVLECYRTHEVRQKL